MAEGSVRRFWDQEGEYTAPFEPEPGTPTAYGSTGSGSMSGRRSPTCFDYGDEWRVMLTLAKTVPAETGTYPRIVASRGEAPPQ